MARDHRRWHRRILPTAHKLLLHRHADARLRSLTGDVLVVGAGQEPYRKLLLAAGSACITDIDPLTAGLDLAADAHDLPFRTASFDAVVAIEVFEHLHAPAIAASEMHRVLRQGGTALVTIPFLFRVHGDPHDYQRFTARGLETLFQLFSVVSVLAFGSRRHVVSDIVTTATPALAGLRFVNHILAAPFLRSAGSEDCPSGYVVSLVK